MTSAEALAQRHAALGKANRVRVARAQLMARLRARQITLLDALEEDCAQTARVFNLLLQVPGVGRAKATKILRVANVSATARVERLSARQRLLVGERRTARP